MPIARKDPTRTFTLRKAFLRQMRRRIRRLQQSLKKLLVDEDALGLKVRGPQSASTLARNLNLTNQQFGHLPDAEKIEQVKGWLDQQIEIEILGGAAVGGVWWASFIDEGYRRGIGRSYDDTRGLTFGDPVLAGRKAEFITRLSSRRSLRDRRQSLHARVRSEIEGVSASIKQVVSRSVADGLSEQSSSSKIVSDATEGLSTARTRADAITQTEIVRAFSEGQLDTLEELGVEEVTILSELVFSTAGDSLVCPQCSALEGTVFKISEARGVIPIHPRCRCALLPVNNPESQRRAS